MVRVNPMLCAIAGLFASLVAQAMPQDLRAALQQQHCKPVERFYHRSGEVAPDFLNRQDGRPTDGTWWAVAWCENSRSAPNKYSLVFFRDGLPLQRDGCPFRIDTSTPPKGLTIHWTRIPLSDFVQLGTALPLKAPGTTPYPPLVDTYGSSGTAYYCHNKTWYVAPLD